MRRRVLAPLGVLAALLAAGPVAGTVVGPAAADDRSPVASDVTSDVTSSPAPVDTATEEPTVEPTDDEPTDEPTEEPTGEPTEEPDEEPDDTGAFAVADAQLRWAVNDESNNTAFAPGTYNFLSAGRAPDPGAGGQIITAQGRWPRTGATAWRASAGEVRVEKVDSAGRTSLATLAGLRTGPDGEPLGSPTSGIFSSHQVVIAGGTGEVDPEAGIARIAWEGSFTLFSYSGMSFFSLSDPVLTVTPTRATLTATGTGFASSMDDQSRWEPLPATRVTVAELTGVDTEDLAAPRGFVAQTRYRGVQHIPADGSRQVRTGSDWGAFPSSFLRFLERAGTGAYWYSSGGSTDRYKVAAPLTVSWDARTAIEPEAPVVTPGPPQAQPENPAGPEPPASSPPPVIRPAGPPLPLPGAPVAALGAAPDPLAAAGGLPVATDPAVHHALASSPTSPERPATPSQGWEWALGSLLLLGAAGVTVAHPLMNRSKGTR